ncbi:hypothetical protein E4U53_003129 [Claviceps sorghi]|nr:hypothetical protein E4U53_003129 [Claviceps sorghi]
MAFKTWLICSLALAPLSVGQPAGKSTKRIRRVVRPCLTDTLALGKLRRHQHDQDIPHGLDIIVYDEKVASATRVREVIEWVDAAGHVVGTATENVLLLPTSLAPNAVADETTPPQCTKTLVIPGINASPSGKQYASLPAPARPQELTTASKTAKPQATKGAEVPSGAVHGNKKPWERFGVSYTPYRADHGCKSQQDIDDDFRRMAGSYSVIRVYGTDCKQVPMVYSAAKTHKLKLFLGIWDLAAVQEEANKIIAGIHGDWAMVDTVSVGNELVNNGKASPADVTRAVSRARSILRAAGYKGPVVAVDTFTAVLAHPELCNESDYCAINAHAFFDSTVLASESGAWLQRTISNVRSAISDHGKKIVVTETGWPTRGAPNAKAVPSLENQNLALQSIKHAFASSPESIILFSAFNDLWKKEDMATFNADQYWGIGGAVSSCDQQK